MAIRIIRPIFTFNRTQDQASSWNVFIEHLKGAHADDAWHSVVDAWIDGSLVRWLERQLPDTALRVKELGYAGDCQGKKTCQEALATALFGEKWPDGVQIAIKNDEKKWLQEIARPGEDWIVTLFGDVRLDMVWVEPGSLWMGSHSVWSDAFPVHQVILTRGYWIGRYPISQQQWKTIDISQQAKGYWVGNQLPMEAVNWDMAIDYCKKLNGRLAEQVPSGWCFTLPTEAQWEFAARGGVKTRGYEYSGSNSIEDVAWIDSNSGACTHEIGQKIPNELGIYDMSGNVWEWCQDWYHDWYLGTHDQMLTGGEVVSDPQGPATGSYRVARGGSYHSNAWGCRSVFRQGLIPSNRYRDVGFRVTLVPVP